MAHSTVQYRSVRPSGAIGTGAPARLAAVLPALVLMDPVLLWPLLYAVPLEALHPLSTAPGAYSNYLLHKVWLPPLFGLAALAFLFAGSRPASLRTRYVIWFGLFFAWAALSLLWAISPGIAASRLLLQMMIAGCLYCAFAACPDPKRVLEPVFWLLVLTAVVNLYAVATRAAGPIGHEGIYEHKNNLGAFAVMTILLAVHRLGYGSTAGRLSALATVPICVMLLAFSQSKTSTGLLPVALVGGLAACAVYRQLRISTALQFCLALVACGLAIAVLLSVAGIGFWDVAEMATGDETFTGRTGLWAFAVDQLVQRPVTGYGFRSFWQIGNESPSLATGVGFVARATHAHNGYIDILLHGGIVALALFLPVLLIGLHLPGRIARHRYLEASMLMGFMVFFVLYNLLETSWFYGAHTAFVMFQIIWLAIVFDPSSRAPARAPVWRVLR